MNQGPDPMPTRPTHGTPSSINRRPVSPTWRHGENTHFADYKNEVLRGASDAPINQRRYYGQRWWRHVFWQWWSMWKIVTSEWPPHCRQHLPKHFVIVHFDENLLICPCLSNTVNTIATDDLVPLGAMVSAGMELINLSGSSTKRLKLLCIWLICVALRDVGVIQVNRPCDSQIVHLWIAEKVVRSHGRKNVT